MGAPPTHDSAPKTAPPPDGVWLTDREPGEILGARRVVVYLQDSEPIVVAVVPTRQEATSLAERVIESIDVAAQRMEWVELGDRIVRPEAIVSIDVELAE